jgi:DUF1680 family protein
MNASLQPIPLNHVRLNDQFWSKFERLVREVVIPYQYEALHDRVADAEPSYAIHNFRVAAGREVGDFGGMVFQDSDVAKWLEAVGYSLLTHPDAELERAADEVIDLVAEAQQPDGYINTYFTIKEPNKRWTNLGECHELYCAGHLIEAAVSYYQATGKTKLLDVMSRFADYIGEVFGSGEGQLQGYDGHQEIELALVKLYKATGKKQYIELSRFFIEQRGQQPNFLEQEYEQLNHISFWNGIKFKQDLRYHQAHLPVREQLGAVGHSVRAMYMYTAMANLAEHTGDQSLYEACVRLWNNTVHKQMYITGGIGSNHEREAFSCDYELPNDTVYAETCASIGLVFFAHSMLQVEARGEYADVMERALYNTIIAGMSQDGKHYFYVNPLEVWPQACEHNPGKFHVKPVRQKWYGCACCPPNVARLLASLGQYIYSTSSDTLYTHLYIGGEAEANVGGSDIRIVQQTEYPRNGLVKLQLTLKQDKSFTVALRMPGWCSQSTLSVNGQSLAVEGLIVDGYVRVNRIWQDGDQIEFTMDMSIQLMYAHPQVRANAGKLAIQRGPFVYALEEIDNGAPIQSLRISQQAILTERYDPELLGGCVVIEGEAYRDDEEAWGNDLYKPVPKSVNKVSFKAIPYYLWGNRGQGDMAVWIHAQ